MKHFELLIYNFFLLLHHSTRKDARLLEQSRCLSHIWHLHNSQNWSLGALSAALQQVNRAEKVNSDLEEVTACVFFFFFFFASFKYLVGIAMLTFPSRQINKHIFKRNLFLKKCHNNVYNFSRISVTTCLKGPHPPSPSPLIILTDLHTEPLTSWL